MFWTKNKNGRNNQADNSQDAKGKDTGDCAACRTTSASVGDGESLAQQPVSAGSAQRASHAQRPSSINKDRNNLKWFIFYRSFADALDGLPDATRLRFYDAMIAYSFRGEEAQFQGFERNLWVLIRTRLDLNIEKATKYNGK